MSRNSVQIGLNRLNTSEFSNINEDSEASLSVKGNIVKNNLKNMARQSRFVDETVLEESKLPNPVENSRIHN